MINSLLHDVGFHRQGKEHSANVIVESMLRRWDSDSFLETVLEAIIDYTKDDAVVDIANEDAITLKGRRMLWKTAKGWNVKVALTNDLELWLLLKDLKESDLVEVVAFVKARDLEKEPAFCWWIPHVLRKRDAIISSVTSRVQKITHEHGTEMPAIIEDDKRLDVKNGNDF